MSETPSRIENEASAPQQATELAAARSPDTPSVQLKQILDRIGLSVYYEPLMANSFDSWDTILGITEQDLKHLSFKLGHRRKLQREIANFRHKHSLISRGNSFDLSSVPILGSAIHDLDNAGGSLITPPKTDPEKQGYSLAEEGELQAQKMEYMDNFALQFGHAAIAYDALLDQADQLEHGQTAVELAMSEIQQLLRVKPRNVEMFSIAHLPPYEATMLAVTAFLHSPGARMFIWTQEDASRAISAVYGSDSQADPVTLVDLLAMATAGTLCGCNCYTEELRSSYYFSCLQLFSECTETAKLSCMRVFTCLSLCSTLSHPISASRLNAAALEIGRTELSNNNLSESSSPGPARNWRKVFQSVIFMECWFEYGFGFDKRLIEGETNVECARLGCSTSIEDMIQEQAYRAGCLAVDIDTKVRRARGASVQLIKAHMKKLNEWYWALPPTMQLGMLSSGKSEIFSYSQKLSILLVHVQSLSAVALLHRPVLIAIAKSQLAGTWASDNTIERYDAYEEYCVVAAQQVARIAAILQLDGRMPKHCWMTIFESSNACCILLFSAAQKLFYGFPAGIEIDFEYIQNFVEMLEWCGTSEPVSRQILNSIKSIISAIKRVWHSRSPHAQENGSMGPENKQQSRYKLHAGTDYFPERPIFEFISHSPPTPPEQSIDKLPFTDMHIDDGASDHTNMKASSPMDSNLAAILEQIMNSQKSRQVLHTSLLLNYGVNLVKVQVSNLILKVIND